MVDERVPVRRSRGFLTPIISALLVIGAIVAIVAFRSEVWRFVKWLGNGLGSWFTEWVPDHKGQAAAILGFAVVAFVINWLAHVRGRFRAWVFAIILEVGLWLLFWYSVGIPSFNELLGLNIEQMSAGTVIGSAIGVVAVTGVIFWILESREEWRKYRRRHNVVEDE